MSYGLKINLSNAECKSRYSSFSFIFISPRCSRHNLLKLLWWRASSDDFTNVRRRVFCWMRDWKLLNCFCLEFEAFVVVFHKLILIKRMLKRIDIMVSRFWWETKHRVNEIWIFMSKCVFNKSKYLNGTHWKYTAPPKAIKALILVKKLFSKLIDTKPQTNSRHLQRFQ